MAINPIIKQQVQLANGGKLKIKKRFAKWLFPYSAERVYIRELRGLFRKINKRTKEIIYPNIEKLINQANSTRVKQDDSSWVDNVTELKEKLILDYNLILSPVLGQMALGQAQKISNYNKGQAIKVIHSALSINPILAEPYLEPQIKAFQRNNVALITRLSEDQAGKIEEVLYRNLSAGNATNIIKKELLKTFQTTEKRAKLIARDQTNKFNGDLSRLRQEEVGISQYIWSTSKDERVRPTHRENENKKFNWGKRPSTGHPGQDINCRCTAQPVITEEMFE